MGVKARHKKIESEENIFWVTMSDLFIGMFMIFATLFFAFCANSTQGAESAKITQKVVKEMVAEMEKKKITVDVRPEDLKRTKAQSEKKVDIEIDPYTGMVKISDLEMFGLNSSNLTPAGKQFLTKFIPIYFDSIFLSDLKKYVKYITIQGHTDSNLFRGSFTPEQQYMKNMNLSINRAYNVAEFAFQLCKGKPYYSDLTHIMRVEGASSTKPILVDGQEDFAKSRRVELRLSLQEQKLDALNQFLKQGTGGHSE